MKIILLRHGETIWNQEGRLQGCQDIPLSDTGAEQIHTVGTQLVTSGIHIDHILSSPLQRALKSAEIIARELQYPLENIISSDYFLERNFGECEGLTYGEAIEKYPGGNYPGMETLEALYVRAQSAIDYLEKNYREKTTLVVSHGAFIKSVLGVITNGRISYFAEDIWIKNGTYCLLEKTEEDWKASIIPLQ